MEDGRGGSSPLSPAAAKPVDHPGYLVFDLDADPAESTPVQLPPATLAQARGGGGERGGEGR